MKLKILVIALVGFTLLSSQAQAQTIKGAGSTSAIPLLTKLFRSYEKQSKTHFVYKVWGTGVGHRELRLGNTDFAVFDSPLEKEDAFPFPIQQALFADENIAVIYNLVGLKKPLRISGPVLVAIMSGRITRWDDWRLRKINPGNKLPNKPITVINRSDGSGTNWAILKYLNQTDKSWKVTRRFTNWKVGIGEYKNGPNSSMVVANPNSIGFMKLAYAKANKFRVAEVKSGNKFYSPNSLNYPIATRHYLVWKKQSPRSKEMADFAKWVLADGQKLNAPLFFKPIPSQSILLESQPLTGMGSTLIYPRLIEMLDTYQKQRGIQINYQAVGVAAGINQFKLGNSDFLSIDTPLDKKESFAFPIQQIPVADENFGIIYNLPGLKRPLRISRSTFGAIMHGKITRWNDGRLQKINPDAILPNEPIILIKRDYPTSVDWAVSRYLNQSDKSWKITRDPQWKIGIRGRGFDGISSLLKETKCGMAFVAIAHGRQLKFPFAEVEADGQFYSIDSAYYPIQTRHFLIWKTKPPRARQVAQLARWVLIDGLQHDKDPTFRPLRPEVRKNALAALSGK